MSYRLIDLTATMLDAATGPSNGSYRIRSQ
jgi:hypothetical protein